jgi:hypothetical protein
MKRITKMSLIGLIAFLSVSILSGCSGDVKERNAQDATSALIQQNKNIIAFGHTSVLDLLNKANYKKIPKVNVLLGAQIATWSKGFQLDNPIYYAIEAPLSIDGTPETVFGLMDVTNSDSLVSVISEMGYEMEEAGDMKYFQENDVTFGVRNKLFIVLSKKAPYDGKAALEKAFKDSEGDLSEGKTQDIIETKGDIVAGLSVERLFETSNTSLNPAKKDELSKLVADGYIKAVTQFEEGKMTLKVENLISEELKSQLFFDDNGSGVTSKLSGGKAWMGIATNIDMRKMERFIATYLPEANKKIGEQLPPEASFMLMAMGNTAYSSTFSGQFGLVATGNASSMMGMEFEFNSFLGLGKKSDAIRSLISNAMVGKPMKGDAYIVDNMAIAPRKDGIYTYALSNMGKGKLIVPNYAKDFGKKTFTMFIAFDQIDIKSLELEEGMKVLEIMESLVVTSDSNGTNVVLTTKSKSGNILKQMADYYVAGMKDRMSDLAF